MSEPKFIPGPWEWRKPYDTICYFQLVAIGDYGTHPNGGKVYPIIADDGSAGDEYSPTIDATGPEAHLIAAAPDLYAACKKLEKYRGLWAPSVVTINSEKEAARQGILDGAFLDLQAALAKAEGKP